MSLGAMVRRAASGGALTTSNMPFGITLAHRGHGGHLDMDNALSSYDRLYGEVGNAMMGDADVQDGSDGSLFLMHDSTVDRTTDGTGSTTTFSAATWVTLHLRNLPNPGISTEAPGFLSDFLNKMKTYSMVFDVEPKDATQATAVVNAITAAGLKDQCLFASFTPGALVAARNAGMKVALWQSDGNKQASAAATLTSVNGGAPDYVGIDFTATTFDDAWLTTLINAGVKMAPWTFLRRSEVAASRAKYQALGSDLAIVASNEPVYTAGLSPVRTSDQFATGLYDHGMLEGVSANKATAHKRATLSGGWLVFDSTSASTLGQNMLLGFLCKPTGFHNSIQAKLRYDTIGGTGNEFGYIAFGAPDDKALPSMFSTQTNSDCNCYVGYRRTDGSLRLGKYVNGTFTALGTVASGTAASAGTIVTLKPEIIGSTVQITCPETGQVVSATDTTFRNGYVHVGKGGQNTLVSFSAISTT